MTCLELLLVLSESQAEGVLIGHCASSCSCGFLPQVLCI